MTCMCMQAPPDPDRIAEFKKSQEYLELQKKAALFDQHRATLPATTKGGRQTRKQASALALVSTGRIFYYYVVVH